MPSKQLFCREPLRTSARTARVRVRIAVGLALLLLVTQPAFSETSEDGLSELPDLYTPFRLELPTQNIRAFPRVSLGRRSRTGICRYVLRQCNIQQVVKVHVCAWSAGFNLPVEFSPWRGRGKADWGSFEDDSSRPR